MLLELRISLANANRIKNGKTALLPHLKNVEPRSYNNSTAIKWINIKLDNKYSISTKEIHVLCNAIKDGEILISSANDLANLLEVPIGQLINILYREKNNYRKFSIPKRNGHLREIYAPQGGIKILQERAKVIIDFFYRPKRSAHGFVAGKSIISNAEQHKKRKYVVNIDLEKFFPSINFARIYGIFKKPPFNFGHSAASVFAQLCTCNGELPQGACTSPVLSNLVSVSLDKQLTALAKKFSIHYTRYADDITFSFNQNPKKEIIESIDVGEKAIYEIGATVKNIIESNGFSINYDKFRVQTKKERQSVTGLTVNERVNIPREYIRITRALIHGWSKDKTSATLKFFNVDNAKPSEINHLIESLRNHIYGRLSFIRMVRGSDFAPYLKLTSWMAHNDTKPTTEGKRAMRETETYQVFICHASEDKNNIAIPLYDALTANGIITFIDHIEISWGDSLIEKINSALVKSKYVIAILSESSVDKEWPLKELRSVLAREISDGETQLLTLIKSGDEDIVKSKLPLLADKLYLVYKNNADEIAEKVRTRLNDA